MFSSTTIESSTTKPMANTKASKVNKLIEKPNHDNTIIEPIKATGTVTAGISVALTLPKNKKITNTTIIMAMPSVLYTSSIEP